MRRSLRGALLLAATPALLSPTQDQLLDLQGPVFSIEEDLHLVNGGAVLSDGRVIVANSGSSEVRMHSSDGTLIRRIGRPGAGPGEFRTVSGLIAGPRDSIFVFDWQLRRISVFSPRGEYARTITTAHLGSGLAIPYLIGFFDPTSLLIALRASADPNAPPGIQRPPATYIIVNRQAAVVDTFATLPDAERWVRYRNQSLRTAPVPFGKGTSVAVSSSFAVVADQGTPAVRVLDRQGRPTRTIQPPWGPAPVRERDVERYKEWRMATVPEIARPAEARTLAEIPIPSSRPGFGRVHASRTGEILLERFHAFPQEPGEAVVFSADGRQYLHLRIPAGLEILWIGQGLVLTLRRDELDVESVQVYRIPGFR